MKRKSAELKRLARETLTGRYALPMGALVASQAITVVLAMPFSWNLTEQSSTREWIIYYLATVAIALLSALLSVGIMYISLCMARRQEYQLKDLFYVFYHHPDKYILATLLLLLLCLIPGIPAIVLAVWLSYSKGTVWMAAALISALVFLLAADIYLAIRFGLIYYLLLDHAELGITEAFRQSSGLMKGNKGRMLYLMLSFIGWVILGLLSFGIGYLWLEPYLVQTQTAFYLDVCGELDQQQGFYAEV